MTDPAVIEAAVRALQDSGDEAVRAIDAQFYAAVVLTAVTPLIEAAALERAAKVLAGIKWHSAHKDNMEFTATITCYQMDAIRALKEP